MFIPGNHVIDPRARYVYSPDSHAQQHNLLSTTMPARGSRTFIVGAGCTAFIKVHTSWHRGVVHVSPGSLVAERTEGS